MSGASESDDKLAVIVPDATVRNLETGEVMGVTSDPVALFVEHVRRCAAAGPTFIVFGTPPERGDDGLEDALLELGVPMRYDPAVGPTAQIMEGSAGEWEGEFRDAVLEALAIRRLIPPAVGS